MNLQLVLDYFKQISQIPRQSKKEEKIRQYLVDFATNKNIEYKQDSAWNIVLYVPATFTKMESNSLILQSHMDMVCVKEESLVHDFETDPIQVNEENWYLFSNWTSLWADNGIWMAIMLASVDSKVHPKLELLFTVDEEQWLNWALELDWKMLSWNKLINLDTEDWWDICISSAWWIRIDTKIQFQRIWWNYLQYKIMLSWMKGWHSWVEIDKNRWNAIYLFIDFLKKYKDWFELISIDWWSAENVIPSNLTMFLWIEKIDVFENCLQEYIIEYKKQYDCPDISINIDQINTNYLIVENKEIIINTINSIQDWVYSMSDKIIWLVNTSTNLWIIQTHENELSISYMVRSSLTNELDDIIKNIVENYENNWFEVNVWTKYPWWQQDPNTDFVKYIYENMKLHYNDEAKLVAYHAWLECWIIVDKLWKESQAVSIWPTIKWAHSIDERVEIKSIEKIINVLNSILESF